MQEDRFIRESERARITGVPRTTWWRAECRGEVPKSYPLAGSTKGWSLAEILEWMEQRKSVAA